MRLVETMDPSTVCANPREFVMKKLLARLELCVSPMIIQSLFLLVMHHSSISDSSGIPSPPTLLLVVMEKPLILVAVECVQLWACPSFPLFGIDIATKYHVLQITIKKPLESQSFWELLHLISTIPICLFH